MARVTVEDCLDHVDNHFDLVLQAAYRARQLADTSAEAAVSVGDDKPTVIALREIAEGMTDLAAKEDARLRGLEAAQVVHMHQADQYPHPPLGPVADDF